MNETSAGLVWEERWHPLRQEWVIVASHRQNRPWSGETTDANAAPIPSYDETCYLCAGNTRVSGAQNPDYTGVWVFDNDHPCVGPDAPEPAPAPLGYINRSARGVARVVCYSPQHNMTLAQLPTEQIAALLLEWQAQWRELSARSDIAHVLFFENKGEAVGVSNPHPHCQIYATNFVFKTIENEARISRQHFEQSGHKLFDDIIGAELSDGRRILAQNDGAIAFVPYFARYAYEVLVAPRRTVPDLGWLDEAEITDLAEVLRRVLVQFDNLWQMPFPYVMVLHQAPCDGENHENFGFHIEFHPPLRKPNLLKYLAGPEIGGGSFVSDTCPEIKAAELLHTSPIHYTQRDA